MVAEAVRVVRDGGLPNRTGAMFTTIEGGGGQAMEEAVKQALHAVAARTCELPVLELTRFARALPSATGYR